MTPSMSGFCGLVGKLGMRLPVLILKTLSLSEETGDFCSPFLEHQMFFVSCNITLTNKAFFCYFYFLMFNSFLCVI